jgi:hypothetical protein
MTLITRRPSGWIAAKKIPAVWPMGVWGGFSQDVNAVCYSFSSHEHFIDWRDWQHFGPLRGVFAQRGA